MYHDWVANFERNGAEGFLNRKLAAGANDYSIKNEFLFFLTDSEILAFRKIGKELFFWGGGSYLLHRDSLNVFSALFWDCMSVHVRVDTISKQRIRF